MMSVLNQIAIILISLSQTYGHQCKVTSRSEHGLVLLDHVYKSFKAHRLAACYSACNIEPSCQSLNYKLADKTCQFSNQTRRSKPDKLKFNDSFIFAENPDRALFGSSMNAAKSCQHILEVGDSMGNGEYWIDPEGNGNPLKVFCDMTTDGGGWLMVANFIIRNPSSPPSWLPESTYRGISNYGNNQMGIEANAMNQLRAHLLFSELRFYCSKKNRTTFHVKTTMNNKGEAVVKYFSNQANTLPLSCNSYIRLEGDTSNLATRCADWANGGKWGHSRHNGKLRLLNYVAYIPNLYHWFVGLWLCDDDDAGFVLSLGDFWKVYVR